MRTLNDGERTELLALLAMGISRGAAAKNIRWKSEELQSAILLDAELTGDVAKAEEAAELFLLSKLREASKDPRAWRASAWLLERRCPERYGKRVPLSEKNVEKFLNDFLAVIAEEVKDHAVVGRILERGFALLETLGV